MGLWKETGVQNAYSLAHLQASRLVAERRNQSPSTLCVVNSFSDSFSKSEVPGRYLCISLSKERTRRPKSRILEGPLK